jgi:tRNA threonylcarbamoyl adenosine modification protein YeaZ
MKILALEFSSAQRSVAVIQTRDDPPGVHSLGSGEIPNTLKGGHHTDVVEAGGRSTKALAMVEEALRAAGLEREQIECLAVGLGPGSYVGVRAAIALAQGWQLGRDVKLLGISSAECLAAQAQAEGIHGRVHVVIDAQRDEFYVARYELSAEGRREVEPLRLVTRTEVLACAQAGGMLVGPEADRLFPGSRLLFPRAATLGELAPGRTDFVAGEALVPIYLRQTQFVKAPPPRVLPSS